MRFVLASASPARRATLRAAGVTPEMIVSGVDEDTIGAATTAELVVRLAAAKARAVAGELFGSAVVLGCDSLLDLGGVPLGKPGTAEAATARWHQLRGRTGTLYTGHALVEVTHGRLGRVVERCVGTQVRFGDVTDAEIAAYVGTGEPLDVAGAFTVDGLGGWFVESINGDHHNVVGVSLPVLRELLGELGYGLTDIGYPAVPS